VSEQSSEQALDMKSRYLRRGELAAQVDPDCGGEVQDELSVVLVDVRNLLVAVGNAGLVTAVGVELFDQLPQRSRDVLGTNGASHGLIEIALAGERAGERLDRADRLLGGVLVIWGGGAQVSARLAVMLARCREIRVLEDVLVDCLDLALENFLSRDGGGADQLDLAPVPRWTSTGIASNTDATWVRASSCATWLSN
jgi:hypothetical protein